MIEVENLSFKYDNTLVLKNITFKLNNGHIYGVIGSNGAGKTTLLNCLGNIFYPNEGSILIDGTSNVDNLAYIQSLLLLNDNTYLDNNTVVSLTKKLAKLKKATIDYSYLLYLIEKFSFDKAITINKMSKGTKKIAFLIAALSINTKTLILDEFLDGIDMINRTKIKNELLDYSIKNNPIIIIASHTISDIADLCDNIILLKNNVVQETYDIDDLRAKYSTYQIVMDDIVEKEFFDNLGLEIYRYRSFENICWISIKNSQDYIDIIDSISCLDLKMVDISLEEVIYNEFRTSKK